MYKWGIYGFLGTSWVLITMTPRKITVFRQTISAWRGGLLKATKGLPYIYIFFFFDIVFVVHIPI